MLSLEQCMRLKECGANQGGGIQLHYGCESGQWNLAPWRIWDEVGFTDDELIACPNSDEMLAYIQQRWPHYGMIMLSGPSCDPNAKWLASTADSLVGYFEATSDAGPADALCELICTLSAQERE